MAALNTETVAASAPRAVPTPQTQDNAVQLVVPVNDCADPEISIVVPALNEEITIGEFVRWCRQGLERAHAKGEVLIVDSSTDKTAEIAVAEGARVLRTPKRGLGRAYIDALASISPCQQSTLTFSGLQYSA